MRWVAALAVLAAAFYGLWIWHQKITGAPMTLPGRRKSAVEQVSAGSLLNPGLETVKSTAAAVPKMTADILLSPEDLARIRASTQFPDPAVRWTAMELLYTMRDPWALKIVQRAATTDPAPEVRLKAMGLLRDQGDLETFGRMTTGLKDTDTAVRMTAARTLGDMGHPAALPYLSGALNDYDNEVKIVVLQAMGKIEDKRKADFALLSDKLRKDYELAVKKAHEAQEPVHPVH